MTQDFYTQRHHAATLPVEARRLYEVGEMEIIDITDPENPLMLQENEQNETVWLTPVRYNKNRTKVLPCPEINRPILMIA